MERIIYSDNTSLFKFFLGITFYTFLILAIFGSIGIKKAFSVSNPVTPTPTMSSGTCKAVVTYSWNVSNIPDANRVLWELKKGSDFTNLESPENGREDVGASNNIQGSVTIDLREYGQVLNGTKYYFRVVAKDGTNDVARRSDSVKFDLNYSPDNTYSANTFPQDPYQVSFIWNLPNDIKNCSDHAFYEIKRNSNFTRFRGSEPGRLDGGELQDTDDSRNFNLSQYGQGSYYFRIVGKSGGNAQDDDVGTRGSAVMVEVGQQATPTPTPPTPTPTPTPTSAPPPPQTTPTPPPVSPPQTIRDRKEEVFLPVRDLELSIRQIPSNPVTAGQSITYIVEVKNSGNTNLNNIRVNYKFSQDVDYNPSDGTNGFKCERQGGAVNCTGGSINSVKVKDKLP
jgi:uncharacterized repeat protein (TIGR01451 family)